MNLFAIFFTGLTVGGLGCVAVQGGLLASVIAVREETEVDNPKKHAIVSTAAFIMAKLLAYTILGFLLGAFGGAINLSGSLQNLMQFLAGVYMVLVALNLFEVHPIFRYVIFSPPRFLARLVKNQAKSKDIFAPALLGAMTVFVPCGTTVAMEALAISSASPWNGAAIMAAFTLGTIPVFAGIGLVSSVLSSSYKKIFLKTAAIIVFYLGLTAIDNSLITFGFPLNSQTLLPGLQTNQIAGSSQVSQKNFSVQTAVINVMPTGYSPNYLRVKKDIPLTLTVISNNVFSCALGFRIPTLGVKKNLQANDSFTFTFTPTQTGQIPFNCSMGMYRGVIEVL